MKWKYLYIWLIGLLAIGCFDDDTTVDTVRISEIAIDTNSLQKEYNRDKNQINVQQKAARQTGPAAFFGNQSCEKVKKAVDFL